jgi:signal transduction histidine kinase
MKKIYLFLLICVTTNIFSQDSKEIDKILGNAFWSKDSSNYFFNKAKKLIKTDRDQAQYYFCKGALNGDNNILDSAVFYNSKAIPIFKKLKDSNSLLFLYNNNSLSFSKLGQYEKALENSFMGLSLAEKTKNAYWVFQNTSSLSNIYHDFENFEKGIFYGKKAFDLVKDKKDKSLEIATALNLIAINYDDWNKPNEAIKYHKKVFDYVKGNDTLKLFSTYNNIGNTLLKQKKFTEAEKWLLRAKKIDETVEKQTRNDINFYNKATYSTNLAIIAYKLNQFDKAEKWFEKAKEYAIKSSDAEKLRDYYYQEYLFNKERNNLEKAIESQDAYLNIRDSVFNLNRDKVITEIETKYQTAQKEKLLLEKEIESEQKNTTIIILIIILFFILLLSYLIFRQQKLKNKQQEQEFELKSAISQIEKQNELQQQRLSISKDLHDNIGAQLTFIISSVETAKYATDIKNTSLEGKLSNISNFTKDTIVELRDTIWAMNSDAITFEDLRLRILNFIEKATTATNSISFSFIVEKALKDVKLSSIEGMNVYRCIQEAINNAIKYSHASNLLVETNFEKKTISIIIKDNGIGFDVETIAAGNGLQNMQKRMEEIDGTLQIVSEPAKGTQVTLNFSVS